MKLLVFATLKEALATIDRLKAKEIDDIFHFDGGKIVISGMGSYAALGAVLKHGKDAYHIWNLGIAGSLDKNGAVGQLEKIELVSKFTSFPIELDPKSLATHEETLPHLPLRTPGKKLLTSDFPIFHTPLRDTLALKWDLVDMEGYGVAYAASILGIECTLEKIVSDFACEKGRESLQLHLKTLSEKLAEVVYESVSS